MTPKERARIASRGAGCGRPLTDEDMATLREFIEDQINAAIEEERENAKDIGVSYDEILEGNLSERTKHEVFEWLWAQRRLDNDQYRLAMSRIKHIEAKRQN